MSTQYPPFYFVIPAKAWPHGKLRRAFCHRSNTAAAPFSSPIHAAIVAADVGPGLRQDDGCGEVFTEHKSGALKQVGTAKP
jgi:hypothetical protein